MITSNHLLADNQNASIFNHKQSLLLSFFVVFVVYLVMVIITTNYYPRSILEILLGIVGGRTSLPICSLLYLSRHNVNSKIVTEIPIKCAAFFFICLCSCTLCSCSYTMRQIFSHSNLCIFFFSFEINILILSVT